MSQLERNICEAIDLIVQKRLSELKFDKTIHGIIEQCSSVATGEYRVRYQDSLIIAYCDSPNTIFYKNGTPVFILVPSNDLSARKTIMGATSGEILDNLISSWTGEGAPEGGPNDPARNWSGQELDVHLGDTYRNLTNDLIYVFKKDGSLYHWVSALGAGISVEYSETGANAQANPGTSGWHPSFLPGDIYMRQRTGAGIWEGPIQIVGEDGLPGEHYEYIFLNTDSLTTPPKPVLIDHAGWSGAPVTPLPTGYYLWMSIGKVSADGALIGVWSTPVRISGETGFDAALFSITNASAIFKRDAGNIIAPAGGISLTTSHQNITGTPTYQWKKDGSNILNATASSYTVPVADFAAAVSHVYSCAITGTVNGANNVTLTDQITAVRLDDGSSTVTIILSNENMTFAAPVSGYDGMAFLGGGCTVQAYIGTEQLNYGTSGAKTFSCITSMSGVTVAAGAGSGQSFAIPAPTAISADSSATTVVVTIRDAAALPTVVNKVISYSVSRAGVSGDSMQVEFSSDQLSWHLDFLATDIFMHQKLSSSETWSNPIKIVGENGSGGPYTDYRFLRSVSAIVTAPDAHAEYPIGWSDTPPAGMDPLYMTSVVKHGDDSLNSYIPLGFKSYGASFDFSVAGASPTLAKGWSLSAGITAERVSVDGKWWQRLQYTQPDAVQAWKNMAYSPPVSEIPAGATHVRMRVKARGAKSAAMGVSFGVPMKNTGDTNYTWNSTIIQTLSATEAQYTSAYMAVPATPSALMIRHEFSSSTAGATVDVYFADWEVEFYKYDATKSSWSTPSRLSGADPEVFWIEPTQDVIFKDSSGVLDDGAHSQPVVHCKKSKAGVTTSNTALPAYITVQDNTGAYIVGSATTATAISVNGYTLAPANTARRAYYTIKMYSGTTIASATLWDQLQLNVVYKGGNAITPILSNASHVLPAETDGTDTDETGSGTDIRVYEGGTLLDYDGVGMTSGTWNVSVTSRVGVTEGVKGSPLGVSPNRYVAYGVISNNTMNADVATITFTITGRTKNGTAFTLVQVQSLAKSKRGSIGDVGPKGRDAVTFIGIGKTSSVVDGSATPYLYSGNTLLNPVPQGTVIAAAVDTPKVNDLWVCTNFPYNAGASPGKHTFVCTVEGTPGTWVSTDSIIVNGETVISGGLIKANSLVAGSIAAGTITVDKLNIGNFTNLHPDPFFSKYNTVPASDPIWSVHPAGVSMVTDVTYGTALKIAAGGIIQDCWPKVGTPVIPGETYRISVMVKRGLTAFTAGTVYAGGCVGYQIDGITPVYSGNSILASSLTVNWTEYDFEYTVPDNVFSAKWWVSLRENALPLTSGNVYFSRFLVSKKVDSSLVVDGSIRGDQLEVGTVTADSLRINSSAVDSQDIVPSLLMLGGALEDTFVNPQEKRYIQSLVQEATLFHSQITSPSNANNQFYNESESIKTDYDDAYLPLSLLGSTNSFPGLSDLSSGTQYDESELTILNTVIPNYKTALRALLDYLSTFFKNGNKSVIVDSEGIHIGNFTQPIDRNDDGSYISTQANSRLTNAFLQFKYGNQVRMSIDPNATLITNALLDGELTLPPEVTFGKTLTIEEVANGVNFNFL